MVYKATIYYWFLIRDFPRIVCGQAVHYHYAIIAERVSVRHWITVGQRYGASVVCPSRFWNAIKTPCMRDGRSICVYVFV